MDLDAREYTSYKLNELGLPAGVKPHWVEPSGGTLSVTIETIDTGERKQMFGFTARHLIIRQKQVPCPKAVSQGNESEQDGWYIDLDVNDGCLRLPRKHGIGVGTVAANRAGEKTKMDSIVVHQSEVDVGGPWFRGRDNVAEPDIAAGRHAGALDRDREDGGRRTFYEPIGPCVVRSTGSFQEGSETQRRTSRAAFFAAAGYLESAQTIPADDVSLIQG